MTRIEIVIEPDGTIRHLIDTGSEKMGAAIAGDKIETWRNSHVEIFRNLSPAAKDDVRNRHQGIMIDYNDFWADMLPVGGPVLGPFKDRDQAVYAEIRWLQQHNFPEAVVKKVEEFAASQTKL